MELKEQIIQIYKNMGYNVQHGIEVQREKIEILNNMNLEEIGQAIRNGIKVEEKTEDGYYYIKTNPIIKYNNIQENEFCMYIEIKNNYSDMSAIITINGLPIVLIEFCDEIEYSCIRLQRFMNSKVGKENFKSVQLLVAIDKENFKYKTNNNNSNWKVWNIPNDESEIEEKISSFFKKEELLKLIKDYSIFLENGIEIANYYQYSITEQMMKNLGKQRKQYIYMPTGTGKTLSSLFLLKRLQEENKNIKVILLVDNLHKQNIIQNFEKKLLLNVEVTKSRTHLEHLINQPNTQVIVTTVQKLNQYNVPYLGKIYIIANIDILTDKFIDPMLSKLFPKSEIIIYTSKNFNSKESSLYGYSMEQAIKDNVITKVLYSERKTTEDEKIISLNEEMSKELSGFQTIIITDKNNVAKYIEELRNKRSIATISFISDKETQLCNDINRESGNMESYIKESLYNFNEGKLDVLIVTNYEELSKIRSANIETVYLDKAINEAMFEQIINVLNRKSEGKAKGYLIDYANNKQKIAQITKEMKYKAVEDISIAIHEIRKPYFILEREGNNILKNVNKETNYSASIEEYMEKVRKWIENLLYIYIAGDKSCLEIIQNEGFITKFLTCLQIVDKICVIYSKEVKWKNVVDKLSICMKKSPFTFFQVTKTDLFKIKLLGGTWRKLDNVQKTVATKNLLKLYMNNEDVQQEKLDILSEKYEKEQISIEEYSQEIEKCRKDFINRMKNMLIPDIIKNNMFESSLYIKISDMSFLDKIYILKEHELIDMIKRIREIIEKNIKIGWKQNKILWKKIEIDILEVIYYCIDEDVIKLLEDNIDELLKNIKESALNTIDIVSQKHERELYYIRKKNAYAVAEKKDGKIYILKNSTTVNGISEGLSNGYANLSIELRENGVIVDDRFVEDYESTSWSLAANIVLGRNSNGKIEWKDKNGRSVKENEERSII